MMDNAHAMTTRRLWPRLALLLLLVAAGVLLRLTIFAERPVAVRVVAAEKGRVEETVTNSRAGTVKARRRAKLAPETGGRVVELPHRRGSRVRKGELLLRVNDSLQAAQLRLAEDEQKSALAQADQACLAAERAERERDRNRSLAAQGIVSTDVVDGVESQARTAEAACRAARASAERARSAVRLARAQLAQTVLRAPFDGIVADTFIEVGEWTAPSPPALPIPPVLDLIDTRSIYISAPMDEVDSGRIKQGQPARVSVDSLPGKHFPAQVVEVAPYVLDKLEQNRTVEIELELDDAEVAAGLLPGTSADAEVILSARDDVLRVPTQALIEGGRVLVLDGGRLVSRTLQVGLRNWDWTEVVSGLAAGDRVVTSLDRPEVKAGARARVAEADRP
jgi:HlyD family secretion protein